MHLMCFPFLAAQDLVLRDAYASQYFTNLILLDKYAAKLKA